MTFNAGIEAAAKDLHEIRELEEAYGIEFLKRSLHEAGIRWRELTAPNRNSTRPSSSAPVEQREAVARIIDPGVFDASPMIDFMGQTRREQALAKADAILSLPGSSRDEVLEECALLCEAEAQQNRSSKSDLIASDWFAIKAEEDSQIAKSIRALKSGVAK